MDKPNQKLHLPSVKMASEIVTHTNATGEHHDEQKKGLHAKVVTGEPVMDHEGNILPYPSYKADVKAKDKYGQISPIPRLAEVAALGRKVPTAGGYAIELSKEPMAGVEIPPECYLYDEDRPWVLGKLNPEALDLPEPAEPVPLPQHVIDHLDALEAAANEFLRKRNESSGASEGVEKTDEQPVNANVQVGTKKVDCETNTEQVRKAKADIAMKNATTATAKSRAGSGSPGRVLVRASPVRSASPRTARTSARSPAAEKAGVRTTSKSPARGTSPHAKILSSPRAGSKIMNAK